MAEKTAAFNLETGEMHDHLECMGFNEVAERVFRVEYFLICEKI